MEGPNGAARVFVVGLDEFNRRLLERLPDAHRYRFLPLLDPARVVRAPRFDLPALLEEARARIRAAGPPDAIVGYWDFPTTAMMPILRGEHGLPGPTLESVLRCEHKYWSRLCQREVVPDQVPRFQLVDPFADDVERSLQLAYPFWLKPVKSHSSYLGFGVYGPADLAHALSRIRDMGARFAEPFEHILAQAELPREVAHVHGYHCIAEEMIATQWQCTLEGWVHGGEVEVYGIVDSIREGHHPSFSRYQYPSRLPERARRRMVESAERVVRHLGLDDSPFNVEYYYDEVHDRIRLLEINARISKSHSPLFERVDGASNLLVMVATGLGERPAMPRGRGRYTVAAKFMVRVDHDGMVTRVPTEDELESIRTSLPDVDVQLLVREGMRLSDLANQDSYTFELADLFIGADTETELLDRYHRALERMPFEIEAGGR
ncbi:MAG: ATP-grasp domain-containing protein [Myxococcota bacterium]